MKISKNTIWIKLKRTSEVGTKIQRNSITLPAKDHAMVLPAPVKQIAIEQIAWMDVEGDTPVDWIASKNLNPALLTSVDSKSALDDAFEDQKILP